jgi:hypothetical protein
MDPLFINKEKIASLLPMEECIEVMEKMFRSLQQENAYSLYVILCGFRMAVVY